MKTIWLDTDIGSDIDDALALAYLLNRDDCDLVGISTVTEFDNQRAKLASALCRIARKQIPIHPGLSFPLLAKPRQTTVPQAIALEKWAHDSDFVANSAVDAMRTAIRSRPGEITLLAVGPMTNLGVLFALDPEIPLLLKELVLMCGVFIQPEATEWNAKNDAHGAALTYRAMAPRHLSIGLDVTKQVVLEREQFEPLISTTEMGRCSLDMASAWFKQTPLVTFHDPLAAAVIFEPNLCGYERGQVDVELAEGRLEGQTKWKSQENGPHEIALTVEPEKFFSKYFGVLNRNA
jgi:purine nucleosidase